MTEWWFYHLERSGPAVALPPLLEKCLERDWRVLVSSPDDRRLTELDEALWTYADGSFLPHGRADDSGMEAARQPILLSTSTENANRAQALVLLDGQSCEPGAGVERCMVMFDGRDEHVRGIARAQFKAARDAGGEPKYFQQGSGGGWTQKS